MTPFNNPPTLTEAAACRFVQELRKMSALEFIQVGAAFAALGFVWCFA